MEGDLQRRFEGALAALAVPLGDLAGVAVSGGGDSVALLKLAVGVLGADRVVALHWHHGWCAWDDDAEALVRGLCKRLGVRLEVGRGVAPEGGSWEEDGRRARYAFFAERATALKLNCVMVGHNREDVAEHVLMRLGRGSGVQGLAGFRAAVVKDGVRMVRPLLEVGREELREWLKAAGETWLEDPYNADDGKYRARVRKVLPALAEAGVGAEAVAASVTSLQAADAALEVWVAGVMREAVTLSVLRGLPEEIAVRVVGRLIATVAPAEMLPRRSKRVALWQRLRDEDAGVGELGGARFVWRDGRLDVTKG